MCPLMTHSDHPGHQKLSLLSPEEIALTETWRIAQADLNLKLKGGQLKYHGAMACGIRPQLTPLNG